MQRRIYIAQQLKTDQLDAAILEFDNLKADVVKAFGQQAANKQVVPQIQNLIEVGFENMSIE